MFDPRLECLLSISFYFIKIGWTIFDCAPVRNDKVTPEKQSREKTIHVYWLYSHRNSAFIAEVLTLSVRFLLCEKNLYTTSHLMYCHEKNCLQSISKSESLKSVLEKIRQSWFPSKWFHSLMITWTYERRGKHSH